MSRVVPVQSDVNANKPFFAPLGSGGGTGGAYNPNPSFSTISFPTSDQLATGIINMNSLLTIQDITTTSTAQFFFVANNGPNRFADGQNNSILTYSPGNITNVSLAASQDGNCYLSAYNRVGSTSALYISSATVNVPGNLAVSSINGAAPGGGGALSPDITVSTLTFPRSNQVSRGVINISSLLTVQDTSTPSTAQFFFAANNTENVFSGGFHNSMLMYSPADVTRVALSASQDGNGYLSVFNNVGSTNTLYISTAVVNVPGNLAVSSINGVIPLTGPETSTLQGQLREVRSTLGLI
jgi:hypothetical protein